MTSPVRLAIAGAGIVGRQHVEAFRKADGVVLAALADPDKKAKAFADQLGVGWYPSLAELIAAEKPDGVYLATPNSLHLEGALTCIEAGLPVLVEKPIAADVADGRQMIEAAEAAGIPLAVGHHRRHNPLIQRAKQVIDEGRIGTPVTAQATTWLAKPDHYFEVDWRRRKGAGPIFINLIHDVDLLQFLLGPISEVQALQSNALRGNEVEESAVIALRFLSGALGTVNISDAVVGPLNWELTARENPVYPSTDENAYWIGGTHGSLAIPSVTLWHDEGRRDWWTPISASRFPGDQADPLVRQAEQFRDVVRGVAKPLVTGQDGLAALEVVEAVKIAAETGKAVTLSKREKTGG